MSLHIYNEILVEAVISVTSVDLYIDVYSMKTNSRNRSHDIRIVDDQRVLVGVKIPISSSLP